MALAVGPNVPAAAGRGVPMHEFRATTQNYSPAIDELDTAMRAGRLRHDGNPVLIWCLGNVVGERTDAATCIRPRPGPIRKSRRQSL
jgi:phage terminase large subunit-like protein